MRFEVRALSADNLIETHSVEASDAGEVGRLLEQKRLQPLSITAARGSASQSAAFPGRSNKSFSLLLFSAELLALLEAGLSLVEAFEALLEKESSPTARSVLERLMRDLREGLRFSAALARQPTSSRRSTSASSGPPREPATCRAPCRATSTTRHGSKRCATGWSVLRSTRSSCWSSAAA
jgi:type II secretory pathway component PulF